MLFHFQRFTTMGRVRKSMMLPTTIKKSGKFKKCKSNKKNNQQNVQVNNFTRAKSARNVIV
jgi:hypothetical protein